MELFLLKYGYFLLFLGIAVEGEAFLVAGSLLAHRHYFNIWIVIFVAVIATYAADLVYYLLARARGRDWLDQRFAGNRHFQKVLAIAGKHANLLLLFSRYAFGFRIIIPAACGMVRMPKMRFSILALISGVIWAGPTAILCFYLGNSLSIFFQHARRFELTIVLTLVAAGIIMLLYHLAHRSGWFENLRLEDLHALAPWMIGVMGVLNLASALLPRSHANMRALDNWLPLEVTQSSRPIMIFAGVALIQMTRGLRRQKITAWYVASIALSTSLLMHITRGFDVHNSLIAGLLLAYLLYFRRRFNTLSDPASVKQALIAIPFLLGAIFLYGYIGLHHMYAQYHWPPGSFPSVEAFRAGILIFEPQIAATTRHAFLFLNSIQIGGWLARLYIVILLLRPVILRHREEAPGEQIQTIFATHGDQSLAAFSIQEDKHHLVLCDGQALVGYAVRSHVALACGDPLASEQDFNNAVRQYILHCQKHGWTPCIYEATESHLVAYHNLHLRSLKMAEEAVLDLTEFSLAGGKRATLRAMVHKTAKLGFTLRQYVREEQPDPAIDEQLQEISDDWLREKRLGELGFTMGSFSLENVSHIPLFLCLNGERVEAFCSWLPYRNGCAVVLDLMRKRQSAISGTMDYLLSQSLLSLREQGFVEASLANAPLANVEKPRGGLERGVALLFENMNSIYGYKNLFQFKKKFAPRWVGRYLIYPKGADLPKVAFALTSLHTSGIYAELLLKRN